MGCLLAASLVAGMVIWAAGDRWLEAAPEVVLDRQGGRKLMQNADLDRKIYWLEIHDAKQKRRFKLPQFITQPAPQGYTARLIPGEKAAALINGKKVALEPLPVE